MASSRSPVTPSAGWVWAFLLGTVAVVALTSQKGRSMTASAAAYSYDLAKGKLGEFFDWYEFIRCRTAEKLGLDNNPTPQAAAYIQALVRDLLDPARRAMGKVWTVTSGYRSPAANSDMGGAKNSQHMLGQAVDFHVTGMASRDVVKWLLDGGWTFDQAIWYDPNVGGHVHLSYVAGGKNRREALHCYLNAAGEKEYAPFSAKA